MKDSLISAIASVLGMFITGGFGYLTSRTNQLLTPVSIQVQTVILYLMTKGSFELNSKI